MKIIIRIQSVQGHTMDIKTIVVKDELEGFNVLFFEMGNITEPHLYMSVFQFRKLVERTEKRIARFEAEDK